MTEIQELDQSDFEIESATATRIVVADNITVPSMPRYKLQQGVSRSSIIIGSSGDDKSRDDPSTKPLSIQALDNVSENSKTTITASSASKSKITFSIPTEMVAIPTESITLSLKNCKNLLKLLKKEWEDLKDNPLAYIKLGVSRIIDKSRYYADLMIDKLLSIPRAIFSTFKQITSTIAKSLMPDSGFYFSEHSRRVDNYAVSDKSGNNWYAALDLLKTKSAALLSWFSADRDDQESLQSETKSRSSIAILLDGLQKIVAALLAKREKKKQASKSEDSQEKLLHLEKTAKERLCKAEALRPDLAGELTMPQTGFILASAFDEIPNVDSLIDQAEKKKAEKIKPD